MYRNICIEGQESLLVEPKENKGEKKEKEAVKIARGTIPF